MATRYEYDLDGNGAWRWIAVAANGATVEVSPVGYASLQDCMHAVGLMQAPDNLAVLPSVPPDARPGVPQGAPMEPPEQSLSRLQRRA